MIVIGVPTSISLFSFRMSGFFIRTQPCEMRPGISPGSLVPWTPTMPPPVPPMVKEGRMIAGRPTSASAISACPMACSP